MKLLVVSHTPHHTKAGTIVGWGPTIRELDHLASLVDELVHVAPMYDGIAPDNALPYRSANVRVRRVPASGGETLLAKLGILLAAPAYLRAVHEELKDADVAHIRCPANISLLTLLLIGVTGSPKRRWAKYAGSWPKQDREPWSYRFQRWWLTRLWRDAVTVNGDWPDQPRHIHSLLNPCLTDEELTDALSTGPRTLGSPVRLLYVGSLLSGKGVMLLPEILSTVRGQGIDATLDIVGDGPAKDALDSLVRDRRIGGHVAMHGWLPRPSLSGVYRRAHVMLLPSGSARGGVWSSAEGWPKVLGEGMAYGVVPVASPVSSIPQYFARFETGAVVSAHHPEAYASAVCEYVRDPNRWAAESKRGTTAARLLTYRAYLRRIEPFLGIERNPDDAVRASSSGREGGVRLADS